MQLLTFINIKFVLIAVDEVSSLISPFIVKLIIVGENLQTFLFCLLGKSDKKTEFL